MTRVSFSFGQNWEKYLTERHPDAVRSMMSYFQTWLPGGLANRRLVDVGSGSGLSSFVAHQMGARVTSIDVDPSSVAATTRLWEAAGSPSTWWVSEGSILDSGFVDSLGTFDVVLSWGVLHHTGELWQAMSEIVRLVEPKGLLWIALYTRTRRSGQSLRLKELYNRAPDRLKPLLRTAYAAPKLAKMTMRRDFTPITRYHEERGMDWWRDIEDWLGGLPYEVASPSEVHSLLWPLGFTLERLKSAEGEGDNDVYLYRRDRDPAKPRSSEQ